MPSTKRSPSQQTTLDRQRRLYNIWLLIRDQEIRNLPVRKPEFVSIYEFLLQNEKRDHNESYFNHIKTQLNQVYETSTTFSTKQQHEIASFLVDFEKFCLDHKRSTESAVFEVTNLRLVLAQADKEDKE